TLGKRNPGDESEGVVDACQIREVVANISLAKCATDGNRRIAAKMSHDLLRNVQYSCCRAGANIKAVNHRPWIANAPPSGLDDVIHIDEISALQPVLEDFDGRAGSRQFGEDGQDSSVRIAQRLARAIDILVSQRTRRNIMSVGEHLNHLFLNIFCEAIE